MKVRSSFMSLPKKGKGYPPCEVDREGKWHGVGPFDITTGRPLYDCRKGYQSWSGLIIAIQSVNLRKLILISSP